jgi:predicted DNA-binding transcriptional regulator YafY
VPYSTGGDFVGEIARFADDVLVLGPDDLRTALIRHLEAVAR